MTHWSLFLDESGAFAGQHGSVVAGLLVESPLTHALGVAIKAALSLDEAGIEWPPHAWTLNSPGNLQKGVDEGKVTLSKARAAWMKRATVAEDALAAVFARVTLLLRQEASPMIVETFAGERDVIHAQLGVKMKLGPLFVRQVATAATRQIPGGDTVIFAPASVGYFERATAGVVAADHVANRLLRKVTGPVFGPWGAVVAAVSSAVGIPIERRLRSRPSPGMPLLAAAGAPHEAVASAAAGAPPLALPPVGAHWIANQASAWIRELP